MYRKQMVDRVVAVLRENGTRKPVRFPRHVFHIEDDDGNSTDFAVRKTDQTVAYTDNDVNAIVEACLTVIKEALIKGDSISIKSFGSLGLKYRKPRSTKSILTGEKIDIDGRYVPKFNFGPDLRMCAKMYELSLDEAANIEPPPEDDMEDEDGED